MSITTENITKVYGTQTVLDQVNINIGKGEVVGLLGPNGAGKSTLMKILTGYIPPTSGKAMVNGHDVMLETEAVKKVTGYLPEHNPLYVDMYVKEYLLFMAGIHKLGKASEARIREIIGITGLGPEQNKKIGTLSKGYRQRIGLAQALIHNPGILILDEPTSGLDPNQLVEIRELIRNIGREKTVILSTHIMQEVESVCNRAIIINHGRIVADATTSGLSEMQNHDTIIVEFTSKVDALKLQAIAGVQQVSRVSDKVWSITSGTTVDIRPAISKFAAENNLTLLSLHREEQKLEKVFQELTGGK